MTAAPGEPPALVIRRFRPADTAAVVALFRDTVRRVNSRDYTPEQVRAWAPDEIDESAWRERLAGRFTIVAELDGVLVGFGDLEPGGRLDHLYAHADHQGARVGRALLAALEAAARRQGVGRIVTEASITARPFFARHGYAVLAEQTVLCRGVTFINYRMAKDLS
jgi:putative acetyltransferase